MPYFTPSAAQVQYVMKRTCAEVRQGKQMGKTAATVFGETYNSNRKEQIIQPPTFSHEGFDINSKGEEDPCQPQKDTYQRR
jgi:hypothetical protein